MEKQGNIQMLKSISLLCSSSAGGQMKLWMQWGLEIS